MRQISTTKQETQNTHEDRLRDAGLTEGPDYTRVDTQVGKTEQREHRINTEKPKHKPS